ncbi:MAG: hypothetical protein A2V77_11440 [Anaeromyxobacter sp. RBG_16_69_14]|nr:MAG: hypothetical protein A2V77_11440 [Anaeromyxobacter sp. RBG_16_69_14]
MSAASSEGTGQRWSAWLLERNRRGTRTLLWIHLGLYPTFGVLDSVLAPRAALPWLFGTRGLVTVVSLAMFWIVRSRAFESNADWFASAFIVLGASGISFMTVFMGGLASPYYAGLTLYVVAIGLLFVWPARVIAFTHASIVGSFLVTNVLLGTIGHRSTALSNLAFLSATALISGIGQALLYRTHQKQHEQQVRLERATANLERAHAELQQLDQFKSRFFANMTHELRTPLAIVLTPIELMLQGEMGEFTESQRSSFQTMFKSGLKLLKLINNLLDLSRLEESRLQLKVEEHELVGYLRALSEQTQVLARRKSIALEFHPHVQSATVWCDLERLERVFVNLLSNAIKFTPPGGHVEVSLSERQDAIEVVVQDDGPGFPSGEEAKVFERFYQVEMAGTRQHGGAGIGLALARELVLLHGGTIEARSGGQKGARFTVALRKGSQHFTAEALGPSRSGQEPVESDSSALGLDWGVQLSAKHDFRLLEIDEVTERRMIDRDPDEEARPYTAVVVEDNAQVVRLIHMSLRQQFKVLAALDGLKGLEMVLREQPSLVVTDLMLPGIDGLALTRRLREDPRTRHIPVLMLTALGELDDRVKGLDAGVSAYLTKPFSPRELVACARQLVQAGEQTADLLLTQRMDSLEIVAAGLAHEINNPLSYVKNSLTRVRLDTDSLVRESMARPLEATEQAQLERVAARLHDMLGVADSGLKRIASTVDLMGRYGRAGYRREVVLHDAWEAARNVVAVVLPATGRNVKIELDMRGDGTLECVPEEFNQVLTNLVQNAIEAVPDDTGRVDVSGSVEGDSLLLRVKDNGPGIAPELQAKLFTPFYTTKGPGRGTGLGLTISRRVVQSLRGTLRLVSAPGEGAEFSVRVPRRRS